MTRSFPVVPLGRLRLAIALSFAATTHGAMAQPTSPGARDFHPTYGPPIAGVCVFSQGQALGRSAAGLAAAAQLQGFAKTIQTGLETERGAILADEKALQARKASLSAPQYQQAQSQLQLRAETFDQRTRAGAAELQQTRSSASQQVIATLTPILAAAITAHRCGLVIEGAGLYGANAAMDLTGETIRALDVKLPTVRLTLVEPPPTPKGAL